MGNLHTVPRIFFYPSKVHIRRLDILICRNYEIDYLVDVWVTPKIENINSIRIFQATWQYTGPKTEEGKSVSSQNAYKGGTWLLIKQMSQAGGPLYTAISTGRWPQLKGHRFEIGPPYRI